MQYLLLLYILLCLQNLNSVISPKAKKILELRMTFQCAQKPCRFCYKVNFPEVHQCKKCVTVAVSAFSHPASVQERDCSPRPALVKDANLVIFFCYQRRQTSQTGKSENSSQAPVLSEIASRRSVLSLLSREINRIIETMLLITSFSFDFPHKH